jgi:pyruvate formate lyase activating enzyme
MIIAGIQKLTTLDYPGKLACIIFTQGCNFACGYCHNPEMIPTKSTGHHDPDLEPKKILEFLSRRKGMLDGVVVSGGEPTIQPDLIGFIKKIKELGFLIKLDTNGSNPQVVQKLLDQQLLDYIAMDVKHSLEKYQSMVKKDCKDEIKESILIIKSSGVPYEFRSTILPYYHSKNDLIRMGRAINKSEKWNLQTFRPLRVLNHKLKNEYPFTIEEMNDFIKVTKKYAKLTSIR